MLSWIIEHIVMFVLNEIVLIPYRLGGLCRKGFEYAKAGYSGAILKILIPPISLGLLTIIIFALAGFYVSWILVACIWGLGIMGFINCDVSSGLKNHQIQYQKIDPWIKDFKVWYQEDVRNRQVSWDDYFTSLTVIYGSYALGKFKEESNQEKEAQLNSFITKDSKGNLKINMTAYLDFLADNLGDDLRRKWSALCRNDARQMLKLGN